MEKEFPSDKRTKSSESEEETLGRGLFRKKTLIVMLAERESSPLSVAVTLMREQRCQMGISEPGKQKSLHKLLAYLETG